MESDREIDGKKLSTLTSLQSSATHLYGWMDIPKPHDSEHCPK